MWNWLKQVAESLSADLGVSGRPSKNVQGTEHVASRVKLDSVSAPPTNPWFKEAAQWLKAHDTGKAPAEEVFEETHTSCQVEVQTDLWADSLTKAIVDHEDFGEGVGVVVSPILDKEFTERRARAEELLRRLQA